MSIDRQRVIMPSLEVCATNCKNWDTYRKCGIFLKGRLCASWIPIDLGDPIDYYIDPFAPKPHEGEPVGEVDAEVGENEEVVEDEG